MENTLASQVLSTFGEQPQQPSYSDAAKKVMDWSNPQSQDTPSDVTNAQSKLGNTEENGYCERFVEKMTGAPNMGATAAAAWNNYIQQGKARADVQNAKPGDLVYFAPDKSNGNAGHVGIIADDKGNMISATYHKIERSSLQDWIKNTGQTPLGFVPQNTQK